MGESHLDPCIKSMISTHISMRCVPRGRCKDAFRDKKHKVRVCSKVLGSTDLERDPACLGRQEEGHAKGKMQESLEMEVGISPCPTVSPWVFSWSWRASQNSTDLFLRIGIPYPAVYAQKEQEKYLPQRRGWEGSYFWEIDEDGDHCLRLIRIHMVGFLASARGCRDYCSGTPQKLAAWIIKEGTTTRRIGRCLSQTLLTTHQPKPNCF